MKALRARAMALLGKPNKTWIVLGAAVVVGILAALIARNYLARQIEEIESRGKGKSVNVLVAKQALKRGDVLSSETVAVRPIPIDYAHATAVLPDQFDRISGQRISYEVGAGEMILWGLLESKRVPTFSARVEAGRRAMTVPVDEISSISGMLEPGDVIDLMVTVDRDKRKVTFALLQSVTVMATGQRSVDDPKTGETRQYATVTLDTTPGEAQRVIVAREAGRITALLRNPQDKQAMSNARGDIDTLLGISASTAGAGIPVLYGGGGSRFPEEALTLARRSADAVARPQAPPVMPSGAEAATTSTPQALLRP